MEGSTTASPGAVPDERKGRYHVLRQTGESAYELVESNVQAASDKAAIQAAAKDTGTYLAVPARSFTPRQITVSTDPVIRFGD